MATGAPGTNGVWLYGEDDSEATFSALLNKAGTTVNTQLGLDRTRLTNLEARRIAGLVPIIPTSVSVNAGSGSFNSTTGLISFTGANALTVNGIFSSTYTNYLILQDTVSTAAATDIFIQLKNSGGTLGSGYNNYNISVNTSGAVSGAYTASQGNFNVSRSGGAIGTFSRIELNNPGNTGIKRFLATDIDSQFFRHSSGYNGTATAYTDMIFYSNQTFTTGTVKIYGYN